MYYNLTTHFYLKNNRENAKGQSPVYLRITLNGQRTEISTNRSILEENWNKNPTHHDLLSFWELQLNYYCHNQNHLTFLTAYQQYLNL
jgi:hypothetical protein